VAGGGGCGRGGGGMWEVEVGMDRSRVPGVEEVGEGKYQKLTMQIEP